MLRRSRNSGREFAGWNQLPCGPVLTPNISCTKLKIQSAHADSPIIPKHFLNLVPANLDVGPVYASQIKKLRKRICRMEPAPLWASSHTQYLLYKAQDLFSALDSTIVPKLFLFCIILCWKFGCRTILCFTDHETQEENLQDGTSSLVGQFLHPISLV